jgi:hypothetical protein
MVCPVTSTLNPSSARAIDLLVSCLRSYCGYWSVVCDHIVGIGQLFAIILWVLVLVGRLLVDCALLLPWLPASYCTAVCIAAWLSVP